VDPEFVGFRCCDLVLNLQLLLKTEQATPWQGLGHWKYGSGISGI